MDFTKLAEQWAAVYAAPLPHIIAMIVGVTAVWLVFQFSYNAILSNKNSQIELLKDRISSYEQKLKVTSPDQALNDLQSLRDQLSETRKKLAEIQNPPRNKDGVYQNGKQIGLAAGERIDAANKTIMFLQMTFGGQLDHASSIEFRNLVLMFNKADAITSAKQGLAGTTTFHNASFSIIGYRSD